MVDASVAQVPCDAGAVGGGSGGEALAELAVGGIDAEEATGFGVDEVEFARVGQLLFARVADFDGQDGVPGGERECWSLPARGPTEIGDDDDQSALFGDHRQLGEGAIEAGA